MKLPPPLDPVLLALIFGAAFYSGWSVHEYFAGDAEPEAMEASVCDIVMWTWLHTTLAIETPETEPVELMEAEFIREGASKILGEECGIYLGTIDRAMLMEIHNGGG